jgi:ATP-dependent RNA helicase UAP56/SUB2
VKSVARAIELDKLLVSCNFPSISIHSGLQQEERYDYQFFVACVTDIDKSALIGTLLSKHLKSESLWLLTFLAEALMLSVLISWSITIAHPTQIATCTVLGKQYCFVIPKPPCLSIRHSRAGRFGTKGLAITFVSSDSDQQVMAAIQSRFEVAVPELPDRIDSASYSKFFCMLQQSPVSKA